MLFNSLEFIVFLPIAFLMYWFVFYKTLKLQNSFLLISSYIFYAWWSWEFVLMLALITFLDFIYGFLVASSSSKISKFFLVLSIINNLGILFLFKYYNFFIDQINLVSSSNYPIINYVLPVGISFYTFHGMSYVLDIYSGKQKPIKSLIEYGLFVSFFPLLVAGPIERASHLLPQIKKKRSFDYNQAISGCKLILWGMFKKVVIADSLSPIADNIFTHYYDFNAISLIIGVIAFSFQIYGDFSGYSDIALGTSKLFGFELLSNFKFPYFSRNLGEFWKRWHISLSSWFRDYLYIPLGGSKINTTITIRNTFVIFLISGFWHGASWNFIIWGIIHALFFIPLLIFPSKTNIKDLVGRESNIPSIKELIQILITYSVVCIAWIFFRANDLSHSFKYIYRIIYSIINEPSQIFKIPLGVSAFLYIIPFVILDWRFRKNEREVFGSHNDHYIQYFTLLVTVLFLLNSIVLQQNSSFIYFQF